MNFSKLLPSTKISYLLSTLLSLAFLGYVVAYVVYLEKDEIDIARLIIGILLLGGAPILLSLLFLGFGRVIGKKFHFQVVLRYASIFQIICLLAFLIPAGIQSSNFIFNFSEFKEIIGNTEVWEAENGKSGVVFQTMDPSPTEREVRATIAGFLRSATKDTLLMYPAQMRQTVYEDLPAFEIIGISYAYKMKRDYRITIAYGIRNTYFIHTYNESGTPAPDPSVHFKIEDKPSTEADSGMIFFLSKPEDEINDLKERFRQLIEAETGINPTD